jgi:hypothetical protein
MSCVLQDESRPSQGRAALCCKVNTAYNRVQLVTGVSAVPLLVDDV